MLAKSIFKKILFWFIGIFLTIGTGYYLVAKFLLHEENAYVNLVDKIFAFIGWIFNFVAQHILLIVIIVAVGVIFLITYKIIVRKNQGDKE